MGWPISWRLTIQLVPAKGIPKGENLPRIKVEQEVLINSSKMKARLNVKFK